METQTSQPVHTVDVVVVGAGLSGLRAAANLQEAGLSCDILEATDRVGGKTLSVPSRPSGERGEAINDIGAAWINDTTQSDVFQLSQKYQLKTIKQRAVGCNIAESLSGDVILTPHGEIQGGENEAEAAEAFLERIKELSLRIRLDEPLHDEFSKELDQVTLEEYIDRDLPSKCKPMVTSIIRGILGVEPRELSMLYFLHYCKSGTGLDNLVSESKDGAQYLRIQEGMQTISMRLSEELKPGVLYLGHAVDSITQTPTGVCRVSSSTAGVNIDCKKVIVSIPTPLYSSITFNPELPIAKRRLAENGILGSYSKVVFVFESPWWHETGLSGYFDSELGPATFSFDTSAPAACQWSISCFIVGEPGRQWSQLSESARKEKAWQQFLRIFHGTYDKIPEPVNVIEMAWADEPRFRGAPCPVLGSGHGNLLGAALRSPHGNIHFIGTETSIEWKGYMEGALRSGQRGAREVIQALRA